MKKLSIGVFLLLIVGVFAYPQHVATLDYAIAQAAERIERIIGTNRKIAVLNFTTSSQDLSNYVIDELMDIFINHRVLEVIERSRIDAVLRERNYQTSGEASDEEIRSIGSQLGAAFIILGQLDYSGIAYRFRLYAVDIEKGTRVASTSSDIQSNNKQLEYFLGGGKEESKGSVSGMPGKSYQLSAGGGLLGNYRFLSIKVPGLSGEISYSELGAYAGFSAEFFSYVLLDASGYFKKMSIDLGGLSVSTNIFGLDSALYGKYPFQINSQLALYPLAGIGYDMMLYSTGGSELNSFMKYLDALYLKAGGGLYYDIMPSLRLNAKLLYSFFIYNRSISSSSDVKFSLHGPGLTVGVSYLF